MASVIGTPTKAEMGGPPSGVIPSARTARFSSISTFLSTYPSRIRRRESSPCSNQIISRFLLLCSLYECQGKGSSGGYASSIGISKSEEAVFFGPNLEWGWGWGWDGL